MIWINGFHFDSSYITEILKEYINEEHKCPVKGWDQGGKWLTLSAEFKGELCVGRKRNKPLYEDSWMEKLGVSVCFCVIFEDRYIRWCMFSTCFWRIWKKKKSVFQVQYTAQLRCNRNVAWHFKITRTFWSK